MKLLVSAVLAVVLLTSAAPSLASRAGRRNTALILGGAALYSLGRGRGTEALILGAGTYYAYRRYRDSRGHVHYRRVRVRAHRRHPGWYQRHHTGRHMGWDHSRHRVW